MRTSRATTTEQVALNQQRQLIPGQWLIEFDAWTNDALDSLARDGKVTGKAKTYAGWELEYREAFGIFVDYDPDDNWELRRRQV